MRKLALPSNLTQQTNLGKLKMEPKCPELPMCQAHTGLWHWRQNGTQGTAHSRELSIRTEQMGCICKPVKENIRWSLLTHFMSTLQGKWVVGEDLRKAGYISQGSMPHVQKARPAGMDGLPEEAAVVRAARARLLRVAFWWWQSHECSYSPGPRSLCLVKQKREARWIAVICISVARASFGKRRSWHEKSA